MITLEVKTRPVQLSIQERSLATGAHAREALREKFGRILATKPSFTQTTTLPLDESVLKRMISKYSEQLIYQPLNEIRFWFEYSSGVFVEPGYPPLFYAKTRGKALSPNKSAVAAIGEGVAGFVAQRLYRCRKLARPNHDYPDIVMDAGRRTYLVESKATIDTSESHIIKEVDEAIPRFASYASTCAQLDVRPVVALLVGTLVVSEAVYRSFVSNFNGMKLKICADRAYISSRIGEISGEAEQEHKETLYNPVIESAISELIKIDMRELLTGTSRTLGIREKGSYPRRQTP